MIPKENPIRTDESAQRTKLERIRSIREQYRESRAGLKHIYTLQDFLITADPNYAAENRLGQTDSAEVSP